jgi:MATE family multidrug resistance protein
MSEEGLLSLNDSEKISFVAAARDVWSLALPFTFSFAAYFSLNIIGQLFAGTFSVDEMAGYGLAMMILNSVGFSVVTGLSGGLDTILSQAYGANPRHPMIAIYAQRALVLFSLITVVPACFLFPFSRQWLTDVRAAEPGVIDAAAELLELLTLSVPLWVLSELVMTILGCINATKETFVATVSAAVLNPLLLYLFVTKEWIGYQGLAIAHSANVLVLFSVQLLAAAYTGSMYTFYNGKWPIRDLFQGWAMILRLAVPSMVLMLCEWAAYEVNVLLSARFLTKHHFAAVLICQQLDNSLLACPLAIGTSVTIKVGNYVGAGDKPRAKIAAAAGAAMMALSALVGAVLLASMRTVLPQLFSRDATVRASVEETLSFVAVFFFFDCMLCAWTSILRALGEQRKAAVAAVLSWWAVGIPLGVLLFHMDATLGARAFFLGPAAGLVLGNFLCVFFVLTSTWEPYDNTDVEVLADVKRSMSLAP